MKKHAKQSIELDHLNLAPEAKTEVSNLIQSLLAQAQNERKLLEAKNQALMLDWHICAAFATVRRAKHCCGRN